MSEEKFGLKIVDLRSYSIRVFLSTATAIQLQQVPWTPTLRHKNSTTIFSKSDSSDVLMLAKVRNLLILSGKRPILWKEADFEWKEAKLLLFIDY